MVVYMGEIMICSNRQNAHSGKRSGKIILLSWKFGSIAYKIPAIITGKKIKLEKGNNKKFKMFRSGIRRIIECAN